MEIDPEDFKQLLGLLHKLVETNANTGKSKTSGQDDETDDNNNEEEVQEVKKNNKIKTSNRRLKPVKNKNGDFVNKFLSMRESNMHKNDTEIDKKLNKYPPTQRARQFNFVEVKCRVCGKTEQVAPGLVESINRYKCNRCSTSPG